MHCYCRYRARGILPIFEKRPSQRHHILTSDTSGRSVSCQLGAKSAGEIDQNISGRDNQGRDNISLHEPDVGLGSIGIIIYPYQVTQSSVKDIIGHDVLREPTAPLGSYNYIMAATPRYNVENPISRIFHNKKGTQPTKIPSNSRLFICDKISIYTNIRTGMALHRIRKFALENDKYLNAPPAPLIDTLRLLMEKHCLPIWIYLLVTESGSSNGSTIIVPFGHNILWHPQRGSAHIFWRQTRTVSLFHRQHPRNFAG